MPRKYNKHKKDISLNSMLTNLYKLENNEEQIKEPEKISNYNILKQFKLIE